jgi:ligand-binding sensor domain-containing protein/serine phosphatase RsbU (regulator of sigma subunit)
MNYFKFFSIEKIILHYRRMIFFALAFCINAGLIAQTYYFDNYSVVHGLAQSKVYALLQDQEGYIWLGTAAGVSRFDGVVFNNYTLEDGLAPGSVRTILEDAKGNIWFGHNDGGLTRFNGKVFRTTPLGGEIIRSDITSMMETDDGRLWITSAASGAVLIENPYEDLELLKYEQYKGNRLSDRVFNSYKDPRGTMHFITDMGITVFNPEINNFENYNLPQLPRYYQIITMYEDPKGNIWFGMYNGGLFKYVPSTEEMHFFDTKNGLSHIWISYITSDSAGNVWVGTWGGGITRISGDDFKIFDTSNGLPDNEIRFIVEDLEKNILIGTNNNGLAIFKGEQFVSYLENDGLVNPQVWAIHEDKKGNVWMGTDKGLSVLDPKKEKDAFVNYTYENNFIPEKIRYIREDSKQNIWIGTDGSGILYYNHSKGKFDNPTIEFLTNGLFPGRQLIVTAFEIDKDDNLWFGTTDGLSYYETRTRRGQRLTQAYGLAGNEISALLFDSKDILWVGARGRGLSMIADTLIQKIELDEVFTPLCMAEDQDGNIWIGTEANGVVVYNRDSIILNLRERTGLLADYITSISVDNNNNIYIGTNRGLNKYIPALGKIYTFTRRNGFTGIEAKNNAVYRDSNGKIWFGTVNGVMVYDPSLTRTDYPEPLTHITGFQVNYAKREMIDGLTLNYREKSIFFSYNSISLTNPDAVRYQIMLEGADPDWRPVTTRTSEIYSALPPGKYTFKVKASNSEGVWNSEPVEYSFRINPPWYRRWFSIVSFIIFGLLVIIFYVRYREKQLIAEKKILEQKVAERTHEISLKNIELAEKNKDITDSIRYAKRLQDAILPADKIYPNTFVLFKPKDIVSGDFYWIMEKNEKELIAAVDCTGHGVPGAFMSLIGHSSLNKIVYEHGITQPASILDMLNAEVYKTLHQRIDFGEEVRDGMDIALISFSKKEFKLEYAGAYNSLYHIRKGELTEIKASKFAIGHDPADGSKYENHTVHLEKGDTVYIYSDGYADQFGGDDGKKFMSKKLKNLLISIQDKPMEEQKVILDENFEEWRGNFEQIDDVVLIGRKFE